MRRIGGNNCAQQTRRRKWTQETLLCVDEWWKMWRRRRNRGGIRTHFLTAAAAAAVDAFPQHLHRRMLRLREAAMRSWSSAAPRCDYSTARRLTGCERTQCRRKGWLDVRLGTFARWLQTAINATWMHDVSSEPSVINCADVLLDYVGYLRSRAL